MQARTDKAAFAFEFLDLPEAAQVEGARWEPFQASFLNNDSRFGIDTKARQIAWSFTCALDAVADGVVNPGMPHIFVSVNQDEAKEKIRYVKQVIAGLDEPVRPAIVQESQTAVEIANGSRFLSHPCRPPRGKARARIYLDEMAHYKHGLDREIYRGALPATVKGDGYIRIGSSPLGASGLFWEIATEAMKTYPGYAGWRRSLPWWQIRALCRDVAGAAKVAPAMETEERVRAFGQSALVEIFENMFLEDFQSEHECNWIDETTAWISWDIIKRNQDPDLLWWHAHGTDEATEMGEELLVALRRKKVEAVFVGGIDVGRVKDKTEFAILGCGTAGRLPLRLLVTLDDVPFDDQLDCLRGLVRALPFTCVLVDKSGLGMNLAENLGRTGRAFGVDFTNPFKELLAVEARIQMQRGNVPIPPDRELAYQIHSIKRSLTPSKLNKFDAERNEMGHCYDDDTEILTDSGWVKFEDVTSEYRVATLDDGFLKFEHPLDIQSCGYDGDMIRVKNTQVDLLVTPHHRMYVSRPKKNEFEFLPANALLKSSSYRWHYKKNADWIGNDSPDVPVGTPEQFAEFLGYYISEGCKGSRYRVILYQKPGPLADRMIALLHEMGKEKVGCYSTKNGILRISSRWKVLCNALPDGVAREKRLPREVLDWSPRLLHILLTALVDGDGSRASQWVYYTTSRGLAGDVTELLLRRGWCGSIVEHDTSHPGCWNTRPLWRININRTRLTPCTNRRTTSHWIEHYSGPVHCVTTRTHLVYVRRNGVSVWSGNSDKFWALALAVYAKKAIGLARDHQEETVEMPWQRIGPDY